MFHETVHKAWILFNLSEQSLENFAENLDFRLSINQKFLSIDRVLSSIHWTRIKHWSRHPETLGLFSYHLDRSSQSFNRSKMLNFKFLLRKFKNLNFHFMKLYSPNSNIIITTYPCVYLYIQHNLHDFLTNGILV